MARAVPPGNPAWKAGYGRTATGQARKPRQRRRRSVTTPVPGFPPGPGSQFNELTGDWRVDPGRSHASFMARAFGRTVRGCLPLTGDVRIAQRIEDSAALLSTRTRALTTGSGALDRLLTGPGFLDAGTFPEISFCSEALVRVPTGWRAVGWLRVKAAEHALACQLEIGARDQRPRGPP